MVLEVLWNPCSSVKMNMKGMKGKEGAHLSVESGRGRMARGVTSFMNGEASRKGRELGNAVR